MKGNKLGSFWKSCLLIQDYLFFFVCIFSVGLARRRRSIVGNGKTLQNPHSLLLLHVLQTRNDRHSSCSTSTKCPGRIFWSGGIRLEVVELLFSLRTLHECERPQRRRNLQPSPCRVLQYVNLCPLRVVGCCCWLLVGCWWWLVGCGARCKTFSTAPNMKRYA